MPFTDRARSGGRRRLGGLTLTPPGGTLTKDHRKPTMNRVAPALPAERLIHTVNGRTPVGSAQGYRERTWLVM
jgi:hypothetical protein